MTVKELVLDLETRRSFDEVGGAHNRAQLGVSVVGVYHYHGDRYACYREEAWGALAEELRAAERVIGFNLVGFDLPILALELGDWVLELPTLDLMLEAQGALGHRVSLDSLAKATLGMSKLGSGLDALEYYRAGDWDRLERYCLEDVKLTKALYEHALKNGHLLYQKGKRRLPVAMSFAESPFAEVFRDALSKRSAVKMIYGGKERLVDVHAFDGAYVRGFCHLRGSELTFRLDRVEHAEAAPSSRPLF
ncbi:hypothetical protein BH24DEI1_BH24DEI1_00570 [soil metagenome]